MRAENRRREYQREDHKRLVAQDRMLRANLACDERVENKRFIRRVQQVRQRYPVRKRRKERGRECKYALWVEVNEEDSTEGQRDGESREGERMDRCVLSSHLLPWPGNERKEYGGEDRGC